jgi:hypothetical protein
VKSRCSTPKLARILLSISIMSLALIPTTYVRNDDILVNSGVTIGAAVLELRATSQKNLWSPTSV